MKLWLDIASAVFAFGAALLWLLSAMVALPKDFPITVQITNVPDHLVIGPFQSGVGHSDQLDTLGSALKRQSRLSAFAAISAALAAICQAVGLIV